MTSPETHFDKAIAHGWAHIEELMGAALSLCAAYLGACGMFMPPTRRLEALAHVRRAEAMLRRVLILMAETVKLAPIRSPFSSAPFGDNRGDAPRKHIGFALIETHPSTTPYDQRQPICIKRPRVRFLDEPDPRGAGVNDVAEPLDPLFARLHALQRIVEAPQAAARRMARWLARRRHGARQTPLKLGTPPGADSMFRRDPLHDPLFDAHYFAREALDRMRKERAT